MYLITLTMNCICKRITRVSTLLFLTCLSLDAATLPRYKNAELSPEQRTEDLLSRMTVEEKIGQLLCPYGWPMYEKTSDGVFATEAYKEFIDKQYGGMLWGLFRADPWTKKTLENGLDPDLAIETYNKLQRYAMDSTRLGIPIILAEEAPHGHMAIGTTVFPTSIGLASTWDPDLLEQVGTTVSEELLAVGARIGYGPVIDLARELRWSRVEETYGEDPYLTSILAGSVVHGMSPQKNGWEKGIIATLKHFVAYGAPQGGHNGNVSVVGERDMYENILPTFRNVIERGALSVMTSYNSINGVPCTANAEYINGLLRDDWGFDGFVVSDLYSVSNLRSTHRIAETKAEAGEIAIKAGVDVDLGADSYIFLKERIENGTLDMATLDNAVRRVLLLKFKLGLFDNPYADPSNSSTVRSEAHSETALQVAREGVILLENNGILPLRKDMKVAVVGPNADRIYNQLGDYTAPQKEENIITPLEGISSKIGASNVKYARGCAIRDVEHQNIADAVSAASQSDVIVAFVGGSSARDFETKFMDTGAAIADEKVISDMESGEGFDRATLNLMGLQEDLLKALKETGKPLVVVYIEGRPLEKNWAKDNADALLTQFYPGQAGGTAIADVLFGDYNPAGRLPVSVPRNVGQLPVHYNQPFPGTGNYIELQGSPLYSFGYGLSYTTFAYEQMTCVVTGKSSATVKVTVRNTGSRDGDEVVQLYVTDQIASTVRPRQQLRAFKRVFLKAGEAKELTFELDESSFSLYNMQMDKVVEPGKFDIKVGPSSNKIALRQTVELK